MQTMEVRMGSRMLAVRGQMHLGCGAAYFDSFCLIRLRLCRGGAGGVGGRPRGVGSQHIGSNDKPKQGEHQGEHQAAKASQVPGEAKATRMEDVVTVTRLSAAKSAPLAIGTHSAP